MPSIIPNFEYDIFISYRHNDNRSAWVTDFVNALQEELAATIKEPLSIYFDKNPHDGLLETHDVDKSLEGKLKCLIFIPIVSQTYCDPKSFAWQHEFCAFNKLSKEDQVGRDIKLSNGNVASRILPIKIHDLDAEDKTLIENEIGGVLRAVDFIYKEPGVNRPLKIIDTKADNQYRTDYRNQLNKVAYAIKEIIHGLKSPVSKIIAKAREEISITSEKSIVVLPFVNISNDSEQEYFSDGLTEEIITDLSFIHNVQVTSRSSSMTYKNSALKISEIAKELGVRYVLEGSVRKAAGSLRITAQLIDATKDVHLWAEKYSGTLDDVFEIQEKVSKAITTSLQLKLTQEEDEKMTNRPINNAGAYDSYLRSRYEVQKWNEKGFNNAMAYLNGALDIVGPNAFLFAGKSYVYFSMANFGIDVNVNTALAEDFVNKAFALEPNLPEGHLVLGNIRGSFQGRISDSLYHLNKALLGRPNDYESLLWLMVVTGMVGLTNTSKKYLQHMALLEPSNPMNHMLASALLVYEGKFNESIEAMSLIANRESAITSHFYVFALILNGDREKAIEEGNRLYNSESKDYWCGMMKLLVTGLEHNLTLFNSILTEDFRKWAWRDFQYSHFVAVAYSLMQNKEETFLWLDHAISQGFVNFPFLKDFCPAMNLMSSIGKRDSLLEKSRIVLEKFNLIELN